MLLVCFWLAGSASAQPLDITELQSFHPREEVTYRIDPARMQALDDVLPEARSDRLPRGRGLQFGYTSSAVWAYLPVRSRAASHRTWVVEIAHPLLGDVQAWVLVPGEAPRHFRGGQSVPAHEWPLRNRSFAFPLDLDAGQGAEVVVRAASESSMHLPLTLWSEAEFQRSHRNAYLVLGLFYGIVLAVFCYNLLLYLVLRDPNYLRYVVYIAGYMLFQFTLNGLAFEYLWPASPRWATLATPLLGGSALIAALVFARGFLELPRKALRLDRTLQALIGVILLQLAVTLVMGARWGNPLLALLSAVSTIFLFATAVLCARHGQAQERIYLVSWLALFVGLVLYSMRAFALLPNAFLTEYGVQLGAVLQLTLLSVALGYRMRGIEEQARRVEAEHAAHLEQRVANRTQELNQALTRLDVSYAQLAAKQRLFEALVEAKEAVRDVEDPDQMLGIALRRFAQARPDVGVGFFARGPGRPKLIQHVCFHNVDPGIRDPILEVLRGLPVNASAPTALEHWVPGRNGVLIPLSTSMRQLEGYFLVLGQELSEGELQDIALFAHHIGATLETLLLRLKLERIANTDALTGAFNRNYFNGLLAKAIRDKHAYPPVDFSAVMVDLNGLKEINDRFGHEVGDQLIRVAAQLLQCVCRRSDSIIRWGGDEFLVFCPGTRAAEVEHLLERLHDVNGQACRITLPEGGELDTTVDFSFGVASSSEDSADEVIALADARMLEQKAELYRERRRYR